MHSCSSFKKRSRQKFVDAYRPQLCTSIDVCSTDVMGHDAEDSPSPKPMEQSIHTHHGALVPSPDPFAPIPLPRKADDIEFEDDAQIQNVHPAVIKRMENDSPTIGLSHQPRTRRKTTACRIGGENDEQQVQDFMQQKEFDARSADRSGDGRKTHSNKNTSEKLSRPPAARIRLPPHATSSYADHTKSSRLKQNEKVELSSSQKSPSVGGAAKEPSKSPLSERSSAGFQVEYVDVEIYGRLDRNHESPRRLCSAKGAPSDRRSYAASTPATPLNGTFGINSTDELRETKRARYNKRPSSSAGTYSRERHEQEELVAISGDRYYRRDNECEKCANEKMQLTKDYVAMESGRDQAMRKIVSLEQQLARSRAELLAKDAKVVEHALTNRKLQAQNHEMEEKLSQIDHVGDELHRSNDAMWQLRKGIEHISTAIVGVSQSTSDSTAHLGALAYLTPHGEYAPEIHALQSYLLQFLQQQEARTQSLVLTHDDFQRRLASNKDELSQVLRECDRALRAEAISTSSKEAGEKPLWQYERDSWEALYRDELLQRRQTEERFQKFKEVAEKYRKPDHERQNRELQIDLNRMRDENHLLREKAKNHMKEAQHWETEHKASKVELDARSTGFQKQIDVQQKEMLLYIKEYHKKRNDPDHWDKRALQDRVKSLEENLHGMKLMYDRTKSEKAQLDDAVTELTDVKTHYEREIQQLESARIFGRNGNAQPPAALDAVPVQETPDKPSASSPHDQTKTMPDESHLPRYHLLSATAKRDQILKELRKDQQQRRKEDMDEIKVLEMLRKWYMAGGKLYPPEKKVWEELLKESWWARWHGDVWYKEKARTEEEKKLVDGLKTRVVM